MKKRLRITQKEERKDDIILQARIDASKRRFIDPKDKLIENMTKGDESLKHLYDKWFTYYKNNLDKTGYITEEFIDERIKSNKRKDNLYIINILKSMTNNQTFNINKIKDLEVANKIKTCNILIKIYNNKLDDKVLKNLSKFYIYDRKLEQIRISVEVNDNNDCKKQLKEIKKNKRIFKNKNEQEKLLMNIDSIKKYIDIEYLHYTMCLGQDKTQE